MRTRARVGEVRYERLRCALVSRRAVSIGAAGSLESRVRPILCSMATSAAMARAVLQSSSVATARAEAAEAPATTPDGIMGVARPRLPLSMTDVGVLARDERAEGRRDDASDTGALHEVGVPGRDACRELGALAITLGINPLRPLGAMTGIVVSRGMLPKLETPLRVKVVSIDGVAYEETGHESASLASKNLLNLENDAGPRV